MIEFLTGAFSVLQIRGERIVKILEEKTDVPPAVVERCRSAAQNTLDLVDMVSDKKQTLALIKKSLENGTITSSQSEIPLKTVLLSYRDLRRTLDAIEEKFVGHIVRYNKSDLFFTRLAEVLWEETNLSDLPPIGVTNTEGYFCTWASMGIIFSPPSAEHNLLIFPDLYHEFGHILQQQIKFYGNNFRAELKSHIAELKNQIRRIGRPMELKIIDDINYKWGEYWAEEAACDTLATWVIGPAYGWCNLHLCLQNSTSYIHEGKHPADAARTKHILRVLRRRGFSADADAIEKLWKSFNNISQQSPSNYYQDYHPDGLFTAVMEDVEQSIKDNNIVGIEEGSPMIMLFDQAWKVFNESPETYNEWEEKTIAELKERFKINMHEN